MSGETVEVLYWSQRGDDMIVEDEKEWPPEMQFLSNVPKGDPWIPSACDIKIDVLSIFVSHHTNNFSCAFNHNQEPFSFRRNGT